MDDAREMGRGVSRRKTASNLTFCVKKENDGKYRKVYAALQKKEDDLTEEERQLVLNNADLVKKASVSLKKKEEVKARSEEVEDPDDVLSSKCAELATALRNSHHLVVYTGAGISTAAKIPDYRGSNGIWTLLQKGKDIGNHDLSQAEPTFTHMALFELYSQRMLKYVVSQNCDGLHLRSGLPRSSLSEVHGNMHLEVCQSCRPSTQYWRIFDVTENTGRFTHRTMRRCHLCHSALIDTIVHFGERGNLPWPLNWPAASKAAANADTILCIGSSLKVLKKYPWLFGMDKPARKRPKLYIINLQWTPKDDHAVLKINGRCDRVMQEVMKCLNLKVPEYNRFRDPIFCHATHLHPDEHHTTSQPELDCPFKNEKDLENKDTISEHCLKRTMPSDEADFPLKVRKVDSESTSGIKKEPLDDTNSEKLSSFSLSKNKVEEIEGSGNLSKIKEGSTENIFLLNKKEEALAVLEGMEPKEAVNGDQLVSSMQMPWYGCEPFALFTSMEEVVDQINSSVDPKNVSKSNDLEKIEEEIKGSVLFSGQNLPVNSTSELYCSKVNIENLPSDVDGKENVAVNFTKDCCTETIKSVKKIEIEKPLDSNSGSEKSNKLINFQLATGDYVLDNTLRGHKPNGKNSSDSSEDEVVVLKMLQLEHSYSKALDDSQDVKCSESKEAKQDIKNDSKDVKKGSNIGQDTKKNSSEVKIDLLPKPEEMPTRNLRRISRDAVNYLEEDDDDEEDEEDLEERKGCGQSGRTPRRMQDKHTAKEPDKQNSKQQAKLENKKNVEVEKKRTETCSGPAKSNKPPTPLKNKKLTKADFEMRTELKLRTCDFCLNYYESKTCLFYPSLNFRPRQFEGCICECCDYSSDSEEVEEDGSNGETNEGKGDSTDNAEEGSSKSSVINPGWYGKGYRKRFRKRK